MIAPTEADVGRRVVYREPRSLASPEVGVVTSFNESYVFVRYGADLYSKATHPASLEWESEPC